MQSAKNPKKNGLPSIAGKTTMNTTKIVGLTVLGAVIFGGGGLALSAVEFKSKKVKLKTFPVKYMPDCDGGILQIFHKMENEVLTFLPQEKRQEYLEQLNFCIQNAESILLLEQLAAKYTEVPTKIVSAANLHHNMVSRVLDNMERMFSGLRKKTVQEYVEYLKDSLQEHLQNLDNMGYDYHFDNN